MNVRDLLARLEQQSRENGRLHLLLEQAIDSASKARHEAEDAKQAQRAFISAQALRALLRAIEDRQKIIAIKETRAMTGLGLKDAKDLIEEFRFGEEKPPEAAE